MTADPRRRVQQVFRAIDFVLIIFGLVESARRRGRGGGERIIAPSVRPSISQPVNQPHACVRACAKEEKGTGEEASTLTRYDDVSEL